MMRTFSSSFLLFFYQIALGGLFGLSATPFHELERAFYKSTGSVLFVIAVLGLWGKSPLYWQSLSTKISFGTLAEILFHGLFVILFAAYIVSLWGKTKNSGRGVLPLAYSAAWRDLFSALTVSTKPPSGPLKLLSTPLHFSYPRYSWEQSPWEC